jgi:hypothetical protein
MERGRIKSSLRHLGESIVADQFNEFFWLHLVTPHFIFGFDAVAIYWHTIAMSG